MVEFKDDGTATTPGKLRENRDAESAVVADLVAVELDDAGLNLNAKRLPILGAHLWRGRAAGRTRHIADYGDFHPLCRARDSGWSCARRCDEPDLHPVRDSCGGAGSQCRMP